MGINPVQTTSALGMIIVVMLVVGAVLFLISLKRALQDMKRTRGQASRVRCPFCYEPATKKFLICLNCYNDLYINCPECGRVVWVLENYCPDCEYSFGGT